MSRGKVREVVVTWERTLGTNTFDISIGDNGMAIWHRSRRGWRLAYQLHETPLEETVVGECKGIGCYRSSDGKRVYTVTFVTIVGRGSGASVEESIGPVVDGRFMEVVPGDVVAGGGRDLFVVQNSVGSGGASIYRVLTWTGGVVYQRFRRVHADGCIVPARGRLLLEGSVYRPGDSHCCPSYRRYAQLEYAPRDYEFATVRSKVVPVSRGGRARPPRWAAATRSCRG